MSQRVTNLGMYLCYAVEETAGTRPETGYTIIPEIKTMPDLNAEPEGIDSTTLLETEYTTSEPGLKTLGILAYGANMTDELEEIVDSIIELQETAAASDKRVWFAEVNPKLKKATFWPGKVTSINFADQSVNDMCNTTIYISQSSGLKRFPKPTIGTAEGQSGETPVMKTAARKTTTAVEV